VKKKDGAKLEVDHLDGSHIDYITDIIMKYLLCDPAKLETVCKRDHAERTRFRAALK